MIQTGGRNIELTLMREDQSVKILNLEETEKYVAGIEKQKEETENKYKINQQTLTVIKQRKEHNAMP